MSPLFRRRKRDDDADLDDGVTEVDEEYDDADLDEAAGVAGDEPSDRSEGPHDASELDDDDEASGPVRLDLGGLRVPVHEGVEVRLDVDQQSGQVVAVTVADGRSAVQISVFAAPRNEGMWREVRGEIAAGVSGSGGTVDAVAGSFGAELHAMLPQDAASGGGFVPARFVGVDGPRWFLRGLFTGAAARDEPAAELLTTVLRGCVVVRGSDPMAPGDVLVLQVPEQLPEGLSQGDTSTDRRTLPPPRRGPEITEIR